VAFEKWSSKRRENLEAFGLRAVLACPKDVRSVWRAVIWAASFLALGSLTDAAEGEGDVGGRCGSGGECWEASERMVRVRSARDVDLPEAVIPLDKTRAKND
jgi:hypothetical protein